MHPLRAPLDLLDRASARTCAALHLDAPHVAVALFHCVHRTVADANSHGVASVTPDDLRRFLDAMLRTGYSLVGAESIGNAWQDRQLHITFDDGYFNNSWAVPVLEEFHAPATFFISTANVLSGDAFWWDAVSRRLAALGKSRLETRNSFRRLKGLAPSELHAVLRSEFGEAAMTPSGDADRPFTPSELRDFARCRWVTLGNHTARHTILTRCTTAEAADDILRGRDDLLQITGTVPRTIAYPNGDVSPEVVELARASGHVLGFTCVPKRNPVAMDDVSRMLIGRHFVAGGADYDAVAQGMGAPWLPGARLRAALQH